MSIQDVRRSSGASIPHPRTSDTASVPPPGTAAVRRPWDAWWLEDGARPSTQYWDVETASWRSRGPGVHRAD